MLLWWWHLPHGAHNPPTVLIQWDFFSASLNLSDQGREKAGQRETTELAFWEISGFVRIIIVKLKELTCFGLLLSSKCRAKYLTFHPQQS